MYGRASVKRHWSRFSVLSLLGCIIAVIIGMFGVSNGVRAEIGGSATFENRWSQPALVMVYGPVHLTLELRVGEVRVVELSAGEYFAITSLRPDGHPVKYVRSPSFEVSSTSSPRIVLDPDTAESEAWTRARFLHNIGGYREFIDAFPNGERIKDARIAQIDLLRANGSIQVIGVLMNGDWRNQYEIERAIDQLQSRLPAEYRLYRLGSEAEVSLDLLWGVLRVDRSLKTHDTMWLGVKDWESEVKLRLIPRSDVVQTNWDSYVSRGSFEQRSSKVADFIHKDEWARLPPLHIDTDAGTGAKR